LLHARVALDADADDEIVLACAIVFKSRDGGVLLDHERLLGIIDCWLLGSGRCWGDFRRRSGWLLRGNRCAHETKKKTKNCNPRTVHYDSVQKVERTSLGGFRIRVKRAQARRWATRNTPAEITGRVLARLLRSNVLGSRTSVVTVEAQLLPIHHSN